MLAVDEGAFSNGVPWLRAGEGPPLLVASSLSSEHANPQGLRRRMSLAWLAPFAAHFTVYLVNRRPGLPPGTTMADLAADYADAIEGELGGSVLVHGTSAGGAIVQALAIHHPQLVRRLVVSSSACRLAPDAREEQLEIIRLAESGQGRRAAGMLLASAVSSRWSLPAGALGRLMGSLSTPRRSDMLRVLAAEAEFDGEPGLGRVQAPALVLGGGGDGYYSEDLFRRTAAGMQNGQAVVLPGKSHGYVGGSKATAALALEFLLG